jgi:uroporphyrinogen III methyltransferase/synthase
LIAAGRDPRTPAACVEKATSPQQRHVVATLAAIADAVEQAELHTPVVTVIGLVAAHAGTETASLSLPLAGRRVLITRPRGTSRVLERLLLSSGATPIACPLIKIEYPRCNDRLDAAIRQFDRFDWLLFTSQHGVRAFGKRMHACGLDSRALANLKIAAVGPTTAKALRRMGVMADLIPENYHGESMARLLVQNASCGRLRVLYPCSSLTDGRLAETLRRAGASVDAIRAYETTYESPPVALLNVIREGVDVILFFSPSAVGSFARLGLESGDAVAACVGPVTAAAAERVGIEVAVVADDHTSSGLVTALESYFSPVGAGR